MFIFPSFYKELYNITLHKSITNQLIWYIDLRRKQYNNEKDTPKHPQCYKNKMIVNVKFRSNGATYNLPM